jgi:hypothetical protein
LWLLVQLFIVFSLIVIALPTRSRIEIDPDLDVSPEIAHMREGGDARG